MCTAFISCEEVDFENIKIIHIYCYSIQIVCSEQVYSTVISLPWQFLFDTVVAIYTSAVEMSASNEAISASAVALSATVLAMFTSAVEMSASAVAISASACQP